METSHDAGMMCNTPDHQTVAGKCHMQQVVAPPVEADRWLLMFGRPTAIFFFF